MKKPSARVEKMLMAQTVASILVTVAAIFVAIYISMLVDSKLSFLSIVAAGAMSWIFAKLGMQTVTLVCHYIFYGTDREALIREGVEAQEYFKSQIATLHKRVGGPIVTDTKITATSSSIGTYQEVKMYDWIEVQGKDGPIRFAYHGTIDLRKKGDKPVPEIPEDCVMTPPGILYQVVIPINKTA